MGRSKIRWKSKSAINCIEGYVKNVESFNIEGCFCLIDIRRDTNWEYPRKYKISSVEEAKSIANDLVDGKNLDIHEKNRSELEQKTESEGAALVKLLHDADELIKKLKNRHHH